MDENGHKKISIVVLSTNQGEKFKIAHEPIKALGRQALMFFTEKGLEVLSTDHARCILTRYIIQGENIRRLGGKYEFYNRQTSEDGHPLPIPIAVDTTTMSQCLKYVGNGDTWTLMWTEEVPNKLTMTCVHGQTGRKKWDLNTINPNDINPEYSLLDRSIYSACIMFRSSEFHQTIRDLSTSETLLVMISCDGKRLVFTSEGMLLKTQYEITSDDLDTIDMVKMEEIERNDSKKRSADEMSERYDDEKAPRNKKAILSMLTRGDNEDDDRDEEVSENEFDFDGSDDKNKQKNKIKGLRRKKGMKLKREDETLEKASKTVGKATFDVRDSSPSAWPTCSWYVLSFLQHITKARGFSDTVKIYVKKQINEDGEAEDFPILITYDCANFGSLEFLVGPRVPTDETELIPYSERKMPSPVTVGFSDEIIPSIQNKEIKKEEIPPLKKVKIEEKEPLPKKGHSDFQDANEELDDEEKEYYEEGGDEYLENSSPSDLMDEEEEDKEEDQESIRQKIIASGKKYKKKEI